MPTPDAIISKSDAARGEAKLSLRYGRLQAHLDVVSDDAVAPDDEELRSIAALIVKLVSGKDGAEG